MTLRSRSPLILMFAAVALMAAVAVDRAEMRRPRGLPARGALPAALLPVAFKSPELPMQFKSAGDLGVGKLLVASRGMGDPNFRETVILLVRYEQDGAVGLVLNRRTDMPISSALNLKAAKDRSDPVYAGGPVQPAAVFALYQSATKVDKAENLFGGVYLIKDKDLFEQTISAKPDPSVFHVYLGYAGWTREQLQHEVQLGAWFVFPADTATVFSSDPESLWPQMMDKTKVNLTQNALPADAAQAAAGF